MKQFIIFSLEQLESRYTKEWFDHLPLLFNDKLGDKFEIIQINGETTSNVPTPGAFLDFAATNLWKNEQINKFFHMLENIKNDAFILFTDAWNPTILEIKYIKDLLKKNWTIMSFWHAGSYINSDPLGQLISDKNWSYSAELSFFHACDYNIFATNDHIKQFKKVLNIGENFNHKIIRSGFPMEYIQKIPFLNIGKKNTIVFAARNSPEKQPEIFDIISKKCPEYKWVNCQQENFTKSQYHNILAESKICISFALLETLGIIQHEALQARSIPLVPNHLCYPEEYLPNCNFLYDADIIKGEINYYKIIEMIHNFINNYNKYQNELEENLIYQRKNYFSCDILIQKIKGVYYE